MHPARVRFIKSDVLVFSAESFDRSLIEVIDVGQRSISSFSCIFSLRPPRFSSNVRTSENSSYLTQCVCFLFCTTCSPRVPLTLVTSSFDKFTKISSSDKILDLIFEVFTISSIVSRLPMKSTEFFRIAVFSSQWLWLLEQLLIRNCEDVISRCVKRRVISKSS